MKELMHPIAWLGLALALSVPATLRADESADKVEQVRSSLAVFLPGLQVEHIAPSPMPGLYEVVVDSRLIYVSEDGRFLVQGAIFDLEKQMDLTKPRLGQLRAAAVESLGEDNMLIYEPQDLRYQVTVFTDIDCPYCRKMHGEMADYLAKGIRIRYLLYPRAGLDSPSYHKAVSVWCADDRRAAMDAAKAGNSPPERTCENPIAEHMAVGEKLPIRGTPALVLQSGEVIPGYLPPDRLLQLLEERTKQ